MQLEIQAQSEPLSKKVTLLQPTPQLKAMNTIIRDIDTSPEDFIFYFDRLATLIIEQCVLALLPVTLHSDITKGNEQCPFHCCNSTDVRGI